MQSGIRRRSFVKGAVAGLGLSTLGVSGCMIKPTALRVVVVGGGFAGASAARALRQLDPTLSVTLIEPKSQYIACPLSNLVVAGLRSMPQQTFQYDALKLSGVRWIKAHVKTIDPVKHIVISDDGSSVEYDRLIVAPGIAFRFDAIEGYTQQTTQVMPHAWQAGAQTERLRQQIMSMDDGDVVAISAPDNPYRCPPGPYERASLIAGYLKKHKPRSKVLLLDSKDTFSKQTLFQSAWQSHLKGYIEWQGRSAGAALVAVDAKKNTLYTDFDAHKVGVANVIPPQTAGVVALDNGLTDASGWCPVDALTFESQLAAGVHVIGDAAILNAMPKSAFAANAQAKLCATQVVRLLKGLSPLNVTLANICYSLVTPDYGISVAGVYQAQAERWLGVEGAGGVSPLGANVRQRQLEANYAHEWYRAVTTEAFL